MTRVAYFDCFSGASGDMILGALLDAGLALEALQAEVGKLALPQGAFRLEARQVHRAGFAATKLDVIIEETPRHRTLGEVLEIIRASALPAGDIERIEGVFRALGEVEAKVHGSSVEAVELHEVGAVDAMVDVTGCIAGLRLLSLYDRHRLKWPYRLPPSNGPPSLPSRNGLQNRSSFVPRVNGLPAPSHPTLSAALDDRR